MGNTYSRVLEEGIDGGCRPGRGPQGLIGPRRTDLGSKKTPKRDVFTQNTRNHGFWDPQDLPGTLRKGQIPGPGPRAAPWGGPNTKAPPFWPLQVAH